MAIVFNSFVFFQLRFNLNPTVYCVSLILDGSIRAELLNPHWHGSWLFQSSSRSKSRQKLHLFIYILELLFSMVGLGLGLRTTFRIHAWSALCGWQKTLSQDYRCRVCACVLMCKRVCCHSTCSLQWDPPPHAISAAPSADASSPARSAWGQPAAGWNNTQEGRFGSARNSE